jgi:hypothetical protein
MSRRPKSQWALPYAAAIQQRGLSACALLLLISCGGDALGPRIAAGTSLTLTTSWLPTLDTLREGRYAVWLVDRAGHSTFVSTYAPGVPFEMASPIDDPRTLQITLELPGALPAEPSDRMLLHGNFDRGAAQLTVAGAITQGMLPLRERPGQFTMFTPSDNEFFGYPSHEESGVWLFNMSPSLTEQNDFYVRLTQLRAGWTYEGWMVRDIESPQAIWLSYGKFLPDWTGALNQADDTGWGAFSGVPDFARSHVEDFPGDDWISNPLGYPLPSGLTLPLNLREADGAGKLRWTHVITIEPMSDKGEPIGSERPFVLKLYVDLFGDLNPGIPRTITFQKERVPAGRVEMR